MTRGLIIVKAAHVAEARALAQQPPFSASPAAAEAFLVPANAVYAVDGMTVLVPATLYWASGVFEESFWAEIVQAVDTYLWGGAWEYDMETQPDFPRQKLLEVSLLPLFAAPKR